MSYTILYIPIEQQFNNINTIRYDYNNKTCTKIEPSLISNQKHTYLST